MSITDDVATKVQIDLRRMSRASQLGELYEDGRTQDSRASQKLGSRSRPFGIDLRFAECIGDFSPVEKSRSQSIGKDHLSEQPVFRQGGLDL